MLRHVVDGVAHGFSVGTLAMPTSTVLAPDHFREGQRGTIEEWSRKAVQAGFAAGPFTRAEIEAAVGPFACVPLTVVHTPATPTKPSKDRVCFNASWRPHYGNRLAGIDAINEEVKGETWTCDWFLVSEVMLVLSRAPPTAEVMGFDLADAYQQVPNRPAQRRRFVYEVSGAFLLWLVGMFGIATMAAIFGQLCDILCDWLQLQFPGITARHFADDHMILWDGVAPRVTAEQIYEQVHWFGWRVHATKRFGWSRRFVLLGFEWDLDAGRVTLTEEKRWRYIRKLGELLEASKITYESTASAVGSLVHVCTIFPARRSKLQALYAFRQRFHRANRWHSLAVPTAAQREVKEWAAFLEQDGLSASFLRTTVIFPHLVYSDASDLGCGVVLDGCAAKWMLPGMNARTDIGVMEAWALHLALQAVIAAGARDCIVPFRVDNLGVLYAVRKGRSRSKWTNACLDDMAALAFTHGIFMDVEYIESAANPADAPSRGDCSRFPPLQFEWAAPWQEFLGAAPAS